MTVATTYLSTVLDGRGTIPIHWNQSTNTPRDPNTQILNLGSFSRSSSSGFAESGYFLGGPMYDRGRSNESFTPGPAGSGQINFHPETNWYYNVPGNSSPIGATQNDLVTTLIHEISHGLAFSSGVKDHTTGRGGNPLSPFVVGTNADWYNTYDLYLQRGAGEYSTSRLIHNDVTQSSFAKFIGPASTFTGGNENTNGDNPSNNPTDGLYFGGPLTREVFGGPVPLFSPATYKAGSSISHVNATPLGMMNWAGQRGAAGVRRFQPYEIAILLDTGWNVYDWNDSSGNWKDGVTTTTNPDDTFTLADSRWRTDRGIVLSADGQREYNTFGPLQEGKAPVLPPYGKVTSNIVLNFFGTGGTAYTSSNDLGDVRVARLNLNSTSPTDVVHTLQNAASNPNGKLIFGVNSDGTASVLPPKIVQRNSGAFGVSLNLEISDTTGSGGWAGLTVDGTGGGRVDLGGQISGTGSLTKSGPFTLVLSRAGGNTYSGGTTVSGGKLLVNGQSGTDSGTGSGAVAVKTGGELGGNGRIAGAVTVESSAKLSPGVGPGILTLGDGVTFNSGSTFSIEVNGASVGTGYDRLDVTGVVNLGGATLERVLGGGYTPGSADRYYIITNDGTDAVVGTFSGLANGDSLTIGSTTAYIYYDADFTTNSLAGGNDVVISVTPIPEPAAVLGIAAGGLGVWGFVRRWRRRGVSETSLAP